MEPTIYLDKYDFQYTQGLAHDMGRTLYMAELVIQSDNLELQNTLIKAHNKGTHLYVMSGFASIDTIMLVVSISLEGYEDRMIMSASLRIKGASNE